MNQALIDRLSVLTEEEHRLLNGEPIQRSDYARGEGFVVSGEKMLPPTRMITLRPHTRFVSFPVHSHDYVEMLYMVRGRTVHEFPGREPLELTAGNILLMNCQSVHAIRQCGEEDVGLNLIVQPGFFDEALNAIGSGNAVGRFLVGALKSGESSIPYMHFQVAEVPAIQSLMESLIYALVGDAPAVPGASAQKRWRCLPPGEIGCIFCTKKSTPPQKRWLPKPALRPLSAM